MPPAEVPDVDADPALATRAPRRRGITLALGVSFWLAGTLPLMLLYGPAWLSWRASADWPATTCRIDRTTLQREDGARGPVYALEVAYRWRVGDDIRTGTRWNPFTERLPHVFGADELEAFAAAWQAGAVVPCRVNPRQPAEALLDRSVPTSFVISVGLLATLVLGGLGLVAAGLRRAG